MPLVFIALLLRPWMQQVHTLGVMPRTLADDIMLLVTGSRALHVFSQAFHLTLEQLHDLGGKIAPSKSR